MFFQKADVCYIERYERFNLCVILWGVDISFGIQGGRYFFRLRGGIIFRGVDLFVRNSGGRHLFDLGGVSTRFYSI